MIEASNLAPERIDETLVRNVDVVSESEQSALAAARMLIAGCGSVGGSVVESLTRLGIGALTLADPEVFDLSNLNRQLCLLHEVGQSKAAVAAARARAINPHLLTRVHVDGLTLDNLEAAFRGVNIVFDAVDAATSPWIKYRLHEMACERRIPVMAGFDFGGKAVVYVFDYRTRNPRPFHGRTTAQAHREGNLAKCLTWLGYRHYPADFLPIIRDRMTHKKPWPQVAYCVQAMGALGTRCTIDLLMQRKLPHVIAFDTHMATRTLGARLREYARIPPRLISAFIASRRRKGAQAMPGVAPDALSALLGSDHTLRRVLLAMTSAPSAHNCQPWEFRIVGERRIEIGWNSRRALPAVDPDGHAIAFSLGCAIEAAASVADVEFQPSGQGNFHDADFCAGTLTIHALHASDYARAFGVLGQRSTQRGNYLDVALPSDISDRCDQLVAGLGARAVVARLDPGKVHSWALRGARQLFGRRAYVEELLDFMRLTQKEALANATGFTRDALALDLISAAALRCLRAMPWLWAAARRFGLSDLMSRSAVASIRHSAAFVLITSSDASLAGRINAGRAVMRVWLQLTREHLACQPIDFPISFEEGRNAMLAEFGLSNSERPIVLLRIGRALKPSVTASPRLPLAEVCVVRPASLNDPALAIQSERSNAIQSTVVE